MTDRCDTSTDDDHARAWIAAGVFPKRWKVSVEPFDVRKDIDWDWLRMEGAMTKVPLGGAREGQSNRPWESGGTRSVLTEGNGVPIGAAF